MRTGAVLAVGLALGVVVVGGCGPRAQAPAVATVKPGLGYLEGKVSIGPLQPVERVGMPPATPPPAACTSRGVVIYLAATGVEVQRISFEPDCTYRIALAPGDYRVELRPGGMDRSRELPHAVTISDGATIRLDVSIDTGLR